MGLPRASRRALLLSLTWLAGHCARANAQESQGTPRSVVLDGRACEALAQATLHELVALELAPRSLLSPTQVPAGTKPVWARLSCRGTQAALRVEDAASGGHQELTLDLTETVASAQTRLVALAISELVVSLELEAQSEGSAPSALAAPAASPPTGSARAIEHVRAADVWLSAGLVYAGRPALLGWMISAGAAWHLPAVPLALEADVHAARAQGTVDDGRVRNWMLTGSLALVPTLRRTWIEAGLGAGLRLGSAWLDGAPDDDVTLDAGQVRAFWWGPLLLGSVLFPVHARWSIRAALDVAYVVKPVRGLSASGEVAYALERFVLQACLGAALRF